MSIPVGPTYTNAGLSTATPILDITLSGTYKTKTFKIFESCKIYLLGQKDAAASPAKEVTEWLKTNEAKLRSAG